MTVPVGTRIAHYEVTGWLGAGGMGEVHRARDLKLDRDVAVKAWRDAEQVTFEHAFIEVPRRLT